MLRLTRRDWIFIAACAAVALLSALVIGRWFTAAFPEASIDFRYDRAASRAVAEEVLRTQGLVTSGMKHAVVFESDDLARIFLERSLGLERAGELMGRDVLVWYWRHRWFRPQQQEEFAVEVAPTGELVSFSRTLPEALAMPSSDAAAARAAAEVFLRRASIDLATLELVSESERTLPARTQRILTWESKSLRPAGAPYRYVITVDGGEVSSFARRLRVPDDWIRSYREMRSKNEAAGRVDLLFMMATMIAALAVFISRLKRGDMQIRFLLVIGAVAAVLVAAVSVNSFPSAAAHYDTTSSYPAFIAQLIIGAILQSIGSAMLLIVICGAGEVLYRQRLPEHLALPRLWTRRALASKRVFQSLILGYALVGLFIAYQVAFYVIAGRFGAWAPADVPYDDILNTALPWVAVLFAGFFPAFSEEFLSRAFSVPFFERVLRSRIFAIVLAGFIWGFGHATYPQQPFYIRGLEVGLAGVLLGFLLYRYGLLALLIWHYTVDAAYTSLLLFRSGNAYYIASAAMATLVFAVPLVVSIVLYIRNGGFMPDDDLTNAALPPLAPPAQPQLEERAVELPQPVSPSRRMVAVAGVAVALAALLTALRPASIDDVVDYRIDAAKAKETATEHLRMLRQPLPERTAAIPVGGFRSWDPDSPREEGGAPSDFDDVAATYLVRNGMSVERLRDLMQRDIHAATWMVRLFSPEVKTEYFVEIDPRTNRVAGYHKYADENAAGPRLEREAALVIARSAFATYGVDANAFEIREALSFQQPNRLDWLFHFETPLAADAARRVTVRVMGSEVTQFANTIRVPEAVYREADEETLATTAVILLKVLGSVVGLGLIIAGAILAMRHGGFAWRTAAWATAMFAIVPIAAALADTDRTLFRYNTSIAWETHRLNVITDVVRTAGVQLLAVFLAVAGIASVYPHAARLFSAEGRARIGRAAAAGAITAVALMIIVSELARRLARLFPRQARVEEPSIPGSLGLPMPSLFEIGQSLFGATLFCAAVVLFAVAIVPWRRKRVAAGVTAAVLFCVLLDTAARTAEIPLMLAGTAAITLVALLIARFVLGSNALAWPAAALMAMLLQSGTGLVQVGRPDLIGHGATLLLLAAAIPLVLSYPALRPASAAATPAGSEK
jgi:membrane protease YdiL (CAAX protease family)